MVTAIAAVPEFGGYFSLPRIIVVLVLVLPWLKAATWVPKDAKRVLAPQALWSACVLGAGALGVLLWLAMPVFFLGLLIYVVVTATTLGVYVVYRNSRVQDEEEKVLTAAHLASLFGGGKSQVVEAQTQVKLYDLHNKIVLAPDQETEPPAVVEAYNLTQELLYDLMYRRASEADMAPAGQTTRMRMLIDGVLVDSDPMAPGDGEKIIQYLKSIAGMDVEDRRRPQQGTITVDLANSPIEMMLTAAGTTGGQRMQFRIVQEAVQTNLDELGISEDVLKSLKAANAARQGLLIVASRPRNGLTSTLYSLLRQHDAFMQQLAALESKAVVDLENVTQVSYGQGKDLPKALIALIRRDANVILIDDCPDQGTAEVICRASKEAIILLGARAGDAFSSLSKWMQLVGSGELGAAPLLGVLCQTLLRKLCPNCREAYRPDPQLLAKANISSRNIENFYRPPTQPLTDEKGRPITCPTCQGSGYFGRTAAFEYLEVTDEIRQLVAEDAPVSKLKAACRKNKMLYLQEQALRKVIAGITSIQEVIRVTQHRAKKRQASKE